MHARVVYDRAIDARVPAEYRTQLHEIDRFRQYAKFLSKGAPGHSRDDLKVSELWPDYHNSQFSRSSSDFVCRYGLKCMACFRGCLEQEERVNADQIYLDGSNVCKAKRDYFIVRSCGTLAVGMHQKMDIFSGDSAGSNSAAVASETFAETVGASDRKRRIKYFFNFIRRFRFV